MSLYKSVSSTSGNDAVVTLSAVSGKFYVIESIVYSYSSSITLGNGNLKIEIDGITVFNIDIKNQILTNVMENANLYFQSSDNEEVVLTLKGVSGLIGRINIQYTEYSV